MDCQCKLGQPLDENVCHDKEDNCGNENLEVATSISAKVKLLPPKTATSVARSVGAAGEIATLAVNMKYKGREHSTALPLSPEMISQLALEA
jgi:hypothetical protein